jgi:pyruvate,water dikinase
VDHADIAWSPLFPVAGGIVTGVGGALCHAAVVARELRIPAVVGLADATIRLRDGDLLSLDGSDGTVSVLNHGGAGPDGTHDGGEIGAAR